MNFLKALTLAADLWITMHGHPSPLHQDHKPQATKVIAAIAR